MDKNIIKNILTERFLNEARGETGTPGISVTKAVQKKSAAINKAGLKADEKNVKDADKITSTSKSEPVKFNYTDKGEEDYHKEVEILNGQEMIRYDRMNPEFQEKAKEGIVGSSRMGNKSGKGYVNTEPAWDASSATFGKDLVKTIKASTKKRYDAEDDFTGLGDDVEQKPNGKKMVKHKPRVINSAIKEGRHIYEYSPHGSEKEYEFNQDQKTQDPNPKNIKEEEETEEINEDEELNKAAERYRKDMEGRKYGTGDKKNPNPYEDDKERDSQRENNNNNKKPQIKESMKRLTFKNSFNGVGNALKMIPESYRTDNKIFEMTDGNESYKIRWEGTLSEGRAVVLMASDKTMISEDMARMKHLMGYKSQETLGTVKGNARLNENVVFNDIMNKSKMLIEGELGMGLGEKAKTGDWDKISKKAPEATKDIEGSTSDDKGTKAPKAKTSTGEALDSAKKQAPEAKKHIQGGLKTGTSEIGMGLGESAPEGEWDQISMPQAAAHGNLSKTTYNPKPSTGEWEKISVPHAQDAKKHISMKEGVELGGIMFKPIVFKINVNEDVKKEITEAPGDWDTKGMSKIDKAEKSGKISAEKAKELRSAQPQYTEEGIQKEEDVIEEVDDMEEEE